MTADTAGTLAQIEQWQKEGRSVALATAAKEVGVKRFI